ncbi:MAG: MFS transporter, partial [Actinobacteria bacterium]|nr:MFS transporter [Actinomycetota bacterium]
INMCLPFVSLYLNQKLGVSAATIGLIIGVMTFVGLPMQLVGGALIDRLGRRPVLLFGALATMATYVTIAYAPALWVAALALAVEALFGWSLVLTANNAMVADLAPAGRQTEAFGLRAATAGAGNALGPFAASLLLAAGGSFRVAFLTGAAVVGVFVAAVLLVLRETRPPKTGGTVTSAVAPFAVTGDGAIAETTAQERADRSAHRAAYGRLLTDRRLVLFLLATLPATYCYAQIYVSLPIMLSDVHDISPQRWGLLLAVFALTTSALMIPLTRSVRRRNGIVVVAAGSLLMGVSLTALALVPGSSVALFLLMGTLAGGVCFHLSAAPAVVARLAPPALHGRYMGAWGFAYVGGYGLGTLLGGRALDSLGPSVAFIAVGVVGCAGAVLLTSLAVSGRKRPPRPG